MLSAQALNIFAGMPIFLDMLAEQAHNKAMLRKSKSPNRSANSHQGYLSHAIARMSLDNSIVSQSRTKGKAHNDVPQLQYPMQETWKRPQGNAALPLQPVFQDVL